MEELYRILELVQKEASETELLEWVAVGSSLLYIGLASKENSLCWYPAMIASFCYGILFFQSGLYTKVPLRLYYLAMAFYGLYEWRKGGRSGTPIPIRTLGFRWHALAITSCTLFGIVAGYTVESFSTDPSMPYLDSLTTVFSLFTTWMVARKYLENWYYWIMIDGAQVYLYSSQGLYLTALLFILFTIMAIYGAYDWGARCSEQGES